MAFDGIFARAIKSELNKKLIGGKVSKICQPTKDEVTLLIKNMGESFRLLISASSDNARVSLTDVSKENPMTAPNFCMALRKHLQGATLSEISQVACDRILHFTFDTYNEMGDPIKRILICEIMGRRSNVILINEKNIIIDCLFHIDERTTQYREVLPARNYIAPPPQTKLMPNEFNKFSLVNDLPISKQLQNSFSGFSKGLSDNFVSSISENSLMEKLEKLLERIENNDFAPCILLNEDGSYKDFLPISFGNTPVKRFTSESECLDEFFRMRDEIAIRKSMTHDLQKVVTSAIERTEKKLKIYEQDIEDASDYEQDELYGNLINANFYLVKEGMSEVNLINYYDESMPEVTISLNPRLSPSQNLQVYFKNYKKKKKKLESAMENTSTAEAELRYLHSVLFAIGNTKDSIDVREIREELEIGGYLKAKKESMKKRPPSVKSDGYIIMETSDGYTCWIGKNNVQNDKITLKLSNPNDMWFHVKNAPGSHVILRLSEKGGEYTNTAINEAARFAVNYSSLGPGGQAEVDFTRVKYVKKPSGAKPGMVVFTNQKTILLK